MKCGLHNAYRSNNRNAKRQLIREYAMNYKASAYGERKPTNDDFRKKGLTNNDIRTTKEMVYSGKI